MEFVITNIDIKNAYKSYQVNWPEKVNNKNSRAFKKTFNQREYEKIIINWMIYKYVGEQDQSFSFFKYYSEDKENLMLTPEISIMQIINHLNQLEIIDNYLYEEKDQIILYTDFFYKPIKGVNRSGFYNKFSLIFREGQWVKDSYDINFIETKYHLNGIIKI